MPRITADDEIMREYEVNDPELYAALKKIGKYALFKQEDGRIVPSKVKQEAELVDCGEFKVDKKRALQMINLDRLKVMKHRVNLVFEAVVVDFVKSPNVVVTIKTLLSVGAALGWLFVSGKAGIWLWPAKDSIQALADGLLWFTFAPIMAGWAVFWWWSFWGEDAWTKIKQGWEPTSKTFRKGYSELE